MRLILDRFLNVGSPVTYPTRAFCSVYPMSDGYFGGLIREFDTRDSGRKSTLRKLSWDSYFRLETDELFGGGEDPRLFVINESPAAVYVSWEGGPDWRIWLSRFGHSKTELTIDGYKGKNWVPVVSKGELYVVRSLDPICILAVETTSGVCTPYVGKLAPDIGSLRGGGNALTHEDGTIYGFGHQTLNPNRHRIFAYDLGEKDPDRQLIFPDPPPELADAGILDPTSHWIDGNGQEFITVCASEREWNSYQLIRHAIVRVER